MSNNYPYQNGQNVPNNGYYAPAPVDAYNNYRRQLPPPSQYTQQYPAQQYQQYPTQQYSVSQYQTPQPPQAQYTPIRNQQAYDQYTPTRNQQAYDQYTPTRNQQAYDQYTPTRNQQAYDQNQDYQVQYGLNYLNGYATTPGAYRSHSQPQPSPQLRTPSVPQFVSPLPQIRTPSVPQFISPSPLQKSPAMHLNTPQAYQYQQSTPSQPRTHSSSVHAIPRMAPILQDAHTERAKLLISLAEEYFQAAYDIAPTAALSMSSADVGSYEKLVATGLGCLETALGQVKLPPRLEANIRLRYAGVLLEETENSREAEGCLSKGIALCERNHYYDLKYTMQFMLTQFMAKSNPKAAMKALDGHINDTLTYHHYAWVYVFRLHRASLGIESGTSTDLHVALQHLQAVATLASNQGDYPVHVVASLMETMAHLKTGGSSASEHARTSLAAAWMSQNSHENIPQLRALTHVLDVISSYDDGNPNLVLDKLALMTDMMDAELEEKNTWSYYDDTVTIPIRRTPKSSQVISADTRMVLDISEDGGDELMLSFLGKRDLYAACYMLCGIGTLHKNNIEKKSLKYLEIGLESIESKETKSRLLKEPGLLPNLMNRNKWRDEIACYYRVMLVFCHANAGDWSEMRQCLDDLKASIVRYEIDLVGPLAIYTKYLQGVCCQGTHDLQGALSFFEDESFRIAASKSSHISAEAQFERDIGILAMLNRLSILQSPQFLDTDRNLAMLEELRPLCLKHTNGNIETAFGILAVTINRGTPIPMHEQKNYLRMTLAHSQKLKNSQFLFMTLALLYKAFFQGQVGDQVEKSARSASMQAGKNAVPLWRSVADGMLADCLQLQGKEAEARFVRNGALAFARKDEEARTKKAMPREEKMEECVPKDGRMQE